MQKIHPKHLSKYRLQGKSMIKPSPYDSIETAWLINKGMTHQSTNNSRGTNNARWMGWGKPVRRAPPSQGRVVWLACIVATLVLGGGLALAQIWRGQDPISDIPTYSFGGASGIEGGYMLHLPVGNSLPDAKGI